MVSMAENRFLVLLQLNSESVVIMLKRIKVSFHDWLNSLNVIIVKQAARPLKGGQPVCQWIIC